MVNLASDTMLLASLLRLLSFALFSKSAIKQFFLLSCAYVQLGILDLLNSKSLLSGRS